MSGLCWFGGADGVGGLVEGTVAGPVGVGADDPALALGHGLFETMRIVDGGELPLWDRHLARLRASARAFGLPPPAAAPLRAAVADLVSRLGLDDGVLRLSLLDCVGGPRVSLTTRPRPPGDLPIAVVLSAARRSRLDPAVAHKTTSRAFWKFARAGIDPLDLARSPRVEVLVTTEDGAVAETETGNVFAELDGRWVTPPADGGILPGVARAVLLDGLRGGGLAVDERGFTPDDLRRATRIAVTNAVHGPRPAAFGSATPGGGVDDLLAVWRRALGRS